ncbi:DNA polymerase III subunit gamma/tau [Synechococcus sp. M16CYN]|uniref:DNA polymerase III subunit gamma/tau n=1 Tax=Synechococcus sp. M16CYN TaxID=3103139 RepID=UPI003253FD36
MNPIYRPLHHKYRPQRFDQLIGQEAITVTLGNALTSNRIAPAYLFSGPRGTGKTSSARILARSLNCQNSEGPTLQPCGSCDLCRTIATGTALDVIEIDAASHTGVDKIRELIERSRFAPVQARCKVYVVDECHMLSTAAFNALLKTLEEPPPNVVFVLATTDPQRVLPTILSRCQRFDFRRIPLEALEKHLSWIAEQEAIAIKPEAIHVVAQRSQGGLRDAESLLDQLSLLPPPIEADAVWDMLGAVPEQELLELVRAMTGAEPVALLEAARSLLDRGRDPSSLLQGLAGILRDLVLIAAAPNRPELTGVSPQFRDQLPELAQAIGRTRLLHWQAQLRGSEQQLRQSVQPRLWFEVLLLGLLTESVRATTSTVVTTSTSKAAIINQTPGAEPTSLTPPIVKSLSSARVTPPKSPEEIAATTSTAGVSLPELWKQILGSLELRSTRMLLSQQAHLAHIDANRAVVRVAGNWVGMVQSRAGLLEQAMAKSLGGSRQLVIEASSGAVTPTQIPSTSAALQPTPVPLPLTPTQFFGPTSSSSQPAALQPETQQLLKTDTTPPATNTQSVPINSSPPTTSQTVTMAQQSPDKDSFSVLDREAKNLADVFNGQVLDIDPDSY